MYLPFTNGRLDHKACFLPAPSICCLLPHGYEMCEAVLVVYLFPKLWHGQNSRSGKSPSHPVYKPAQPCVATFITSNILQCCVWRDRMVGGNSVVILRVERPQTYQAGFTHLCGQAIVGPSSDLPRSSPWPCPSQDHQGPLK